MTLKDYQRLAAFYNEANDEVTQVALLVADMYGFTYEQVDNMPARTFLHYSQKVTAAFSGIMIKPFWCRLKFQTDATKITFGQFIEVQYFLQQGEIDSLHFVGASILKSKKSHPEKAAWLQNKPVSYVLSDIKKFLVSFGDLVGSYKGLFETEAEVDEEKAEMKKEKPHPFLTQYGWIFSATQVAEHEKITLDKAFGLPILQALNALAYLKSFGEYQKKLNS